MEDLTRETLANVNPKDTTGPSFQIDVDNADLVQELKNLRDRLRAEDPNPGGYAPPEAFADRVGVQADLVVEALLASEGDPVYTWALSRAMPHGFGPCTIESFGEACRLIGEIEGVTVTLP